MVTAPVDGSPTVCGVRPSFYTCRDADGDGERVMSASNHPIVHLEVQPEFMEGAACRFSALVRPRPGTLLFDRSRGCGWKTLLPDGTSVTNEFYQAVRLVCGVRPSFYTCHDADGDGERVMSASNHPIVHLEVQPEFMEGAACRFSALVCPRPGTLLFDRSRGCGWKTLLPDGTSVTNEFYQAVRLARELAASSSSRRDPRRGTEGGHASHEWGEDALATKNTRIAKRRESLALVWPGAVRARGAE